MVEYLVKVESSVVVGLAVATQTLMYNNVQCMIIGKSSRLVTVFA